MQAIKQLYKIGYGPSSSHTIAPYRIAKYYKEHYPDCASYKIFLGGSLALTANGHGTINIIKNALECEDIEFNLDFDDPTNSMIITGFDSEKMCETWHCLSLGGGAIRIKEFDCDDELEIFYRSRNHKGTRHPKNTDIITYKHSTGFEAIIGYLYLEDKERLNKIINTILEG